MVLPWIVAAVALAVAVAAWARARQTARRLEQLSQMYWELKYQHGELRAQVRTGLVPPPAADPVNAPRPTGRPEVPGAFVPLASLKR